MLNRCVPGSQWAAVVAAAVAILLVSALWARREEAGRQGKAVRPEIVEVRGEVRNPGTYLLEGTSATVAGALAAAGDIPAEQIREASLPVRTGQVIHAARNASGGYDVRLEPMPAASRLALGLKLDLNDASEEDLLLVPGMKPQFAGEIVRRRRQAAWTRVEDLTVLSGVGPAGVKRWREYLRAGEAD